MLISSTRTSQALPSGLTLDLIRAQARVGNLEDALLGAYASAALELAEHHTGRALTERTVVVELDAFPASGCNLELPLGDIASVTSVVYTDTTGVLDEMDPVPAFVNGFRPGLRAPAAGWPALYGGSPSYLRVTYVTAPRALEGTVLAALLLIITHLYENRAAAGDAALSEIPLGSGALLDTIRIYRV